jgi:hypothetical protein
MLLEIFEKLIRRKNKKWIMVVVDTALPDSANGEGPWPYNKAKVTGAKKVFPLLNTARYEEWSLGEDDLS